MKLRVNDPCPCGSGRKYKKCCLHKASPSGVLAAARATPNDEMQQALATLLSVESGLASAAPHMPPPKRPTSGITSEQLPTIASLQQRRSGSTDAGPPWPGLPKHKSGAKGLITREEESGLFGKEQIAFQAFIGHQATSPAQAVVGLHHLSTLPRDEAMRLEWFGAAKAYLLELLDRREEALYSQIEQMLYIDDPYLWFAWGMRGLQWLQTYPSAPQRAAILEQLQTICQDASSASIIPHLLLAFVGWHKLAPSAGPRQDESPDSEKEAALAAMIEVLRPDEWPWHHKRWMQKESARRARGEWLAAIGDGLSRLVYTLHQHQRSDELDEVIRQSLRFPWKHLHPKFRHHTLRALAGSFAHARLFGPLLRLCQQFAPWMPESPIYLTWHGMALFHSGDPAAAMEQMRRAARSASQLTDAERICIIECAFAERDTSLAAPLLPQLHDAQLPTLSRLWYWFHHLRQEHDEALKHLEQWLEAAPDDFEALCRRVRTLDVLGQHDQMQAALQELQARQEPHTRQFSQIYQGLHHALHGRWESAAALLLAVPTPPDPRVFLDDPSFAGRFWSCLGLAHERRDQWDEAARAYHQALDAYPMGWTCARLCAGLLQREQWSDLEALAPQALALLEGDAIEDEPPSVTFAVRCAYIKLLLHQENPEEARQQIELMGRDAFVQQGQQREWLWLWLQIYLELDAPRDALEVCELHLDEILQDEDLRRLRQQLFGDVMAQMARLEELLGQQEQQRKDTAQLRQQLHAASMAQQHQSQALQHALDEKDSLRETLQRLQQQTQAHARTAARDKAFVQWREENEPLLSRLQPNERQLTCHAERLWLQLAAHPTDDHGPVVLQLARAVEGEINRRLIDPLVAFALAQGESIAIFPRITLGRLKPSHNRLSLGDACKLLYHQLKHKEPDGSVSIAFNPGSQEPHRAILEAFWAQPSLAALPDATQRYLQGPLIQDAHKLASLRNKASHAGRLLSRERVAPIRSLVLDTDEPGGLLFHLAALP